MRKFGCLVMAASALALAGCAATDPRPAPVAGTVHTGEVWTWDERAGTITLRQGERIVRIKASPDQFAGLQLHQVRTIRGEVAPPADLVTVTPPPAGFVPAGGADTMEMSGTVARVTESGIIVIQTDRGPVEVWGAQPGTVTFKPGDAVRVSVEVQPLVPAPAGQPAAPAAEPAPPPSGGPSEYATVRGGVLAVDPSGRLTVESPRGPVTVVVPTPARYQLGQRVEVRTVVRPAG
jgi:hypothetical protein